jgi:hypothetical protein
MKKPIKKLSLNKMTISNLDASEMHQKLGGLGKPNTRADCTITSFYTQCWCRATIGGTCSYGSICCPTTFCPKKL